MIGIIRRLKEAGVGISAFSRRCKGISFLTLQRIDQGDPSVQPAKVEAVRRAYKELQAELAVPLTTRGKAKTVSSSSL